MSYDSYPSRSHSRGEKKKKHVLVRAVIATALVIQGGIALCYYLAHRSAPGARVPLPSWVEQDLLPINPNSRPGKALQQVNGIVIHYVGNPGTSAQANRNYFANLSITRETYASAHYVVGLEGEIVQCVPLSEISYCSNDRNSDTIAIEVCHPDEEGQFNPATYDSVVKLTAWLCQQFKLESGAVIRHYDITGKICPKYYVEHEDAWQTFLQDVDTAMQTVIPE